MWLRIPKPMISHPLLGQRVVQIVGSHLGCIPNYLEVPPTPRQNPPNPPPPTSPLQEPSLPPPPQEGASSQRLVGGVVGVQTIGFTPPPPPIGDPFLHRVRTLIL